MSDIQCWCSALLPSKNRRGTTPVVYLAMRRNIELAKDHPTACPSRFSDMLSTRLGKLGEEISRGPLFIQQQSTGEGIQHVFYRDLPSVVDIAMKPIGVTHAPPTRCFLLNAYPQFLCSGLSRHPS